MNVIQVETVDPLCGDLYVVTKSPSSRPAWIYNDVIRMPTNTLLMFISKDDDRDEWTLYSPDGIVIWDRDLAIRVLKRVQ